MHDENGGATLAPGSAGDGGLTVPQTAELLDISTDAVRRRLKAGELSGHQRQTKHGPAWCVHPEEPPGSRNGPATVEPTLARGMQEGSATVPPGSAPTLGEADQQEPAPGMALMQAEAMAVYTRSVLEPLVAALERSEGRVAELERENGRLAAELAAALIAPQPPVDASTAPESPAPAPEAAPLWWRRWRSWLAAGLVVAVVGSASCSASGSAKHAGLCGISRATIDGLGAELAELITSERFWSAAQSALDVASKTC